MSARIETPLAGAAGESCFDCGSPRAPVRLPHGRLCRACRRRRHYHPEPCPSCGTSRPLAYLQPRPAVFSDEAGDGVAGDRGAGHGGVGQEGAMLVCASCAGAESVFACPACGSEDHPYGARCARCILRERLTVLLTDPATGTVHARLRPVFAELVGSDRPQTGIWWLRKKPGTGPGLLARMARGEMEISHDAFRALPSDRAHNYLRDLLVAVGVLSAYEPRIERMLPWLEAKLEPLPVEQADLVRRFAHWQVLRHLRQVAGRGPVTKTVIDRAREQVSGAIRFLAFLDTQQATVATATQAQLECYQVAQRSSLSAERGFIAWLRTSRINTRLRVTNLDPGQPVVRISDAQRWAGVERLLHDESLRGYVRIGGLFTLLFAQPLSRIVAMRTSQVQLRPDGRVEVAFRTIGIEMPAVVDGLIADHLDRRGKSLYASRETGWLFPGGKPGRHLETENIRRQLVEIGIKPYESRKAALFGLAGQMPAPVLAELLGITDRNAANWARLAARDWTGYVAARSADRGAGLTEGQG